MECCVVRGVLFGTYVQVQSQVAAGAAAGAAAAEDDGGDGDDAPVDAIIKARSTTVLRRKELSCRT